MSIDARLSRVESSLAEAILWREIQAVAHQTGEPVEALFADAKRLLDRYCHLARPAADGRVDMAPALRAMAEGEGLDYAELEGEARRILRLWRRRETRR